MAAKIMMVAMGGDFGLVAVAKEKCCGCNLSKFPTSQVTDKRERFRDRAKVMNYGCKPVQGFYIWAGYNPSSRIRITATGQSGQRCLSWAIAGACNSIMQLPFNTRIHLAKLHLRPFIS